MPNTWRTDFTPPGLSEDALMRTRIAELEAAIVAAGMVKVSATGQLVAAAASIPSSGSDVSLSMGFHIFRFNDALQPSAPVFIRVEYWCTSSSSNVRSLDIRGIIVGTTHDGAGNLGGQVATISPSFPSNNSGWFPNTGAPSNLSHLGVSGTQGRLTVTIGCWNSNQFSFAGGLVLLNIERSKSITGSDTAEAVIACLNGSTQVIPMTGAIPPAENRWAALCSTNNPGRFNNQVGIGLIHPFGGIAYRPLIGLAIAPPTAFGVGEVLTAATYEADVAYRATPIAFTTGMCGGGLLHGVGPRFLINWS